MFGLYGGDKRDRTADLLNAIQALSQLSYTPIFTWLCWHLCQVATHVVCWAGIAPVLDILFYNENMDTIFAEGLTAALSNAVTTAIVGSSILAIYAVLKARRAKKD